MKTQELPMIRVRGTGLLYDDHTFEFTPQKKGEPKKANVIKCGDSDTYTTTGASPKRVLHIVIPASDPDPAASAQRVLEEMSKKLPATKELQKLQKPLSRVLYNDAGKTLSVDAKSGRVRICIDVSLMPCDLRDTREQFTQAAMDISRALMLNDSYLAQQRKRLYDRQLKEQKEPLTPLEK